MLEKITKITEETAIKIVTWMHFILFSTKVIAWIFSWSVAVISDWIHSWVDVLTTFAIWFATKISKKSADAKHQFWYWKAQAIAAFFVAIMAWITWLEISKYWIEKLLSPEPLTNISFAIFVMIWAIIFSSIISFLMTYIWKKNRNSAMIASWKETLWDIAISFSALLWLVAIYFFEIHWIDPVLAIFIWIMILKIAYEIIMENIDLLMWARASNDKLIVIQNLVFRKFPQVLAMHDIHTQKISEDEIFLVVHCEIAKENSTKMNFEQIHNLEEKIQNSLEQLNFVDNCVVHMDYHNDFKINRIINPEAK